MLKTAICRLLFLLIGLALVAAPVGSAHAALAMMQQAAPASDALAADADGVDGMSDCMKAMQQPVQDCDCCDSKSKCPDGGACQMKCSNQVLAVVIVATPYRDALTDSVATKELHLPPGWSSRPPAPPPRA